jgi:hypothetical protein
MCSNRRLAEVTGTVTVALFSCLTGWANEDSGHIRTADICLKWEKKKQS